MILKKNQPLERQEKILVTGSAGFIGHHVVERLVKDGHQVVGVDNVNHYYDPQLKLGRLKVQGFQAAEIEMGAKLEQANNTFYRLDIGDRGGMESVFNNHEFDRVIHLAAQAGVRYSVTNPQKYIDSNVTGFLNIIECCRSSQTKHLVYASSSSVYGGEKEVPFAETSPTSHPLSLYAATKKSNELIAHVYSSMYQLPVTGLRFFTVYGPWARPDMALHLFTTAILNNKPIKLFNEGQMERDFTYIDDVVDGILSILDKIPEPAFAGIQDVDTSLTAPYAIFNIGSNRPTALMRYIEAIEKATGKTAEKLLLPMQPGDMYKTYAKSENLMRYSGFKPATDLQFGVDQFVSWYKDFYKL